MDTGILQVLFKFSSWTDECLKECMRKRQQSSALVLEWQVPGLAQKKCNSSTNALEICFFFANQQHFLRWHFNSIMMFVAAFMYVFEYKPLLDVCNFSWCLLLFFMSVQVYMCFDLY